MEEDEGGWRVEVDEGRAEEDASVEKDEGCQAREGAAIDKPEELTTAASLALTAATSFALAAAASFALRFSSRLARILPIVVSDSSTSSISPTLFITMLNGSYRTEPSVIRCQLHEGENNIFLHIPVFLDLLIVVGSINRLAKIVVSIGVVVEAVYLGPCLLGR